MNCLEWFKFSRGTVASSSRITPQERCSRALQDVTAAKQPQRRGLWSRLKRRFENLTDKIVDAYLNFEYWLHSNHPRGHKIIFICIALVSIALYIWDIASDAIVYKALNSSGLETEATLVLIFMVAHYGILGVMVAAKFSWTLEVYAYPVVDAWIQPGGSSSTGAAHGMMGMGMAAAALSPHGPVRDTSYWYMRQYIRTAQGENSSTIVHALGRAWLAMETLLLHSLIACVYILLCIAAVPLFDVGMLGLELISGFAHQARGEMALAVQNFLLQYKTIRVPSQCVLESVPQTILQAFIYFTVRSSDRGANLQLRTLVASITASVANLMKNVFEMYVAYSVSGFSFLHYMRNALEFEGAAQLPLRWSTKTSTLVGQLVLEGDFHSLAHAQKMKLFQAGLRHPSISITTKRRAHHPEGCVVHITSLNLLGFTVTNLPVSIADAGDCSCAMHLDVQDLRSLPLRDDAREFTQAKADKLTSTVREDLLDFVNNPHVWQNLEQVSLIACGLEGEEVDALVELLIRSRVKLLDLSYNPLGNHSMGALVDGLLHNASLLTLRLVATHITAPGALHLARGLADHQYLTELDLSYNPLADSGLVPVADLISRLAALKELRLAMVHAVGGGLGFKLLCTAVGQHHTLRSLDLSENHLGVSGTLEVGHLLMTTTMLQQLALRNADVSIEVLCEALTRNQTINRLDISGCSLLVQYESLQAAGTPKAQRQNSGRRRATRLPPLQRTSQDSSTPLSSPTTAGHSPFRVPEGMVAHEPVQALAAMLSARSGYLHAVQLRKCELTAIAAAAICTALSGARRLTTLDISESPFLGNAGLGHACDLVVAQKHSMQELHAECIGASCCGPTLLLSGRLAHLSILQVLNLSRNPLGDEGVQTLCHAVLDPPQSCRLVLLQLSAVGAGAAGFNALMEVLTGNTCITELDLSRNYVGSFDLARYAKFDQSNKTLVSLDLRKNRFNDVWRSELTNGSNAAARSGATFVRSIQL